MLSSDIFYSRRGEMWSVAAGCNFTYKGEKKASTVKRGAGFVGLSRRVCWCMPAVRLIRAGEHRLVCQYERTAAEHSSDRTSIRLKADFLFLIAVIGREESLIIMHSSDPDEPRSFPDSGPSHPRPRRKPADATLPPLIKKNKIRSCKKMLNRATTQPFFISFPACENTSAVLYYHAAALRPRLPLQSWLHL